MVIYLAVIESEIEKRKFERLYHGYKQTMYYVAMRVIKDNYVAEDIVHQAFLRIVKQLDKIDESNCHKTRSFLVVITEHIAIDYYRKRKRENNVSFDEAEYYIYDEDFSLTATDSNEIISYIEKLPLNYVTVMKLKYSQGYNDKEIASILHISEDNVRQRISRAKRKLSQLLEEVNKVEPNYR